MSSLIDQYLNNPVTKNPGVYAIYNEKDDLIYIGKSQNCHKRVFYQQRLRFIRLSVWGSCVPFMLYKITKEDLDRLVPNEYLMGIDEMMFKRFSIWMGNFVGYYLDGFLRDKEREFIEKFFENGYNLYNDTPKEKEIIKKVFF
jgi:hypothetical protein